MTNAVTGRQLAAVRHLAIDLDGTIYSGGTLFPETLPFLEQLRHTGLGYTFLTNNSSRSAEQYLEKLAALGIAATREQLVTSTDATLQYLRAEHPKVRRLFVLGTESLQREFTAAGFEVVEAINESAASSGNPPDAVVVGFDSGLSYDRLCRAAYWIAQGKPFIATNPDLVCPTDEPNVLVDCGSICAALTAATGVKPAAVCGKPDRRMLDVVLAQHDLIAAELAMVGDRLYTDMAMSQATGAVGVLVLTGEATAADVAAADKKPDIVTKNLAELGKLLA